MSADEDAPIEPTAEGKRRYCATDGYLLDPHGDSIPCTCNPTCKKRCAGECGCQACSMEFAIFCDDAGFTGFTLWNGRSEEEALRAYRGG
jgi:hypothetical protein